MATWTSQSESSAPTWTSISESVDAASVASAGQAMGVLGLTYAGGEILNNLPAQWTYQTEN